MNLGKSLIGQTPMTDPRSLGSSIAIHAFLLFLASIAVLSVAGPELSALPRTLRGELEPTDNRPRLLKEGGGTRRAWWDRALSNSRSSRARPHRAGHRTNRRRMHYFGDPAHAGYERLGQTGLAGSPDTGLGVLPGPGTGGGGGSGGGSGGGVGRASGPGTEFFGARDRAASFTYVIDCSGSMATKASLDIPSVS